MDIISIIGRFHPVLVHLPIGIFMMVLLLSFLSMTKKFQYAVSSIRFMLAAGIVTALLSLLTGYVLSLEGTNGSDAVDIHQWTAIGMTLIYTVYYFFSPLLTQYRFANLVSLIIMLVMLVITGHQGGSLTHGEEFLNPSSLVASAEKESKVPNLSDLNNAAVYRDLVGYTLQTKCVECHGDNKQKGKLRLDDPTWILKGGKSGRVIVNGDPENSELIKRIILDDIDEHHMPPKGKTQLSAAEKSILTWWVNNGADFEATVASMKPDAAMNRMLEDFRNELMVEKSIMPVRKEVKAAQPESLERLKKAGWVIAPVARGDQHLRATGFNLVVPIDSALLLLGNVSEQLIELKLNGSGVNDTTIRFLEKFPSLEKLWLENNTISDVGLTSILQLQQLKFLNLSNTGVTINGIKKLIQLNALKSLIIDRTGIGSQEINSLKIKSSLKIYTTDSLIKVPTDTLLVKKAA